MGNVAAAYLLFDLSEHDRIRLALFDETHVAEHCVDARNRDLLIVVDECLTKNKISAGDVGGIMAVVGAGGFTSTRIATTVGNVFAFVHGIPILALSSEDAAHPQRMIPALLAQLAGHYICASYSGEANIGGRGSSADTTFPLITKK